MIGVGPLLESPDGYTPSKSKGEKRLVVYNTKTKQIEKCGISLSFLCGAYCVNSQTPVFNDVRDVTLTKNRHGDLVALVSYEHKAGHHFLSLYRSLIFMYISRHLLNSGKWTLSEIANTTR